MANNVLNANIRLRCALFSQLNSNTQLILQPGEAAVAFFPNQEDPNGPPSAVGIKIGDGQHYFRELPWIQALSSDIYEWAKEPYKPVYQATEIVNLAEYIAAHTSGAGGGGSGTGGGTYQIIWDSAASKYILQEWNEDTSSWVNTSSEIDLSSILNRINTIERWANGARTKLGNIELPLIEYVYDSVVNYLNMLDYSDSAVEHQFVTSVSQVDGIINVSRSSLSASDITSGTLETAHGGTGLSFVDEDEILIGSEEGTITTKKFVTEIEGNVRNTFATTGAIKDYVDEKTAGLTGAMHFIGETAIVIINNSRLDPQIRGYNFNEAQAGDVILANNSQEYVWTGQAWHLLGDEGSYAIKGSIVNADISENAAIAQSKIDGLDESLNTKVEKVDGKQLSTNDYTTEDKEKLEGIEEGAQVNIIEHLIVNDVEAQPNNEKTISLTIPVLTEEQINKINNADPNLIEHIFVNGTEVNPTTISNQSKSVNISHVMTEQEAEKLTNIETGAQVNKIETISFNGGEPISPNNTTKNIDITIDPSALHLNVLEGARYPSGPNSYTSIEKDNTGKLLELSKVAATGNIDDLVQTTNYVIFNCGSSTTVI